MLNSIKFLESLILLVGLSIFIAFLLIANKMLKYLKSKYLGVWRSLGEPTLFANFSPKTALVLLHYLKQEKYKSLFDEELVKLGSQLNKLLLILEIYFIIIFFIFVFQLIYEFS